MHELGKKMLQSGRTNAGTCTFADAEGASDLNLSS